MSATPQLTLSNALMCLRRRAEKADPQQLVQTFVDVGRLFTLLSIQDNQVVFGRRGTGKTHALQYLGASVRQDGDIACYTDLSKLGSSGSLYSDQVTCLPERATRLLVDVLLDIHNELLGVFVEEAERYDLSQTGPLLDELAEAVTQVQVVGTIEREVESRASLTQRKTTGAKIDVSSAAIGAGLTDERSVEREHDEVGRVKVTGVEKHSMHFGSLTRVLEKLAKAIAPHRIWLLFDEWSSVPLDLQPYLADLLRRGVFPVREVTVKIAAIEYRSEFQLSRGHRDRLGLEVGADISSDINLDDFMVFDNDAVQAREFFKTLFHKHLLVIDDVRDTELAQWSADQMISGVFTQVTAFDELVRAAEGVPRDAIHIASLAAQYSGKEKISVPCVRRAAKKWYETGKKVALHSHGEAMALLHWIIDEVIGARKARAFMLQSDVKHPLIEDLFDARVLHVLKRGISTHDEPGVRYDAYKLDYGCYVDLMTTSNAPRGLFDVSIEDTASGFVDVPGDDYRSIRRAILDLSLFESSRPPRQM